MIEVEKKFVLNEENEKRVIAGARFLKEVKFTDIYYDTPDYELTKQDIWLRSRAGKFELKIAAVKKEDSQETNFYHEMDSEKEIRRQLRLSGKGSLLADLAKAGFIKFGECATVRRKYQNREFIIDLDTVTYADSDFVFKIGEIELLVPTKDDMPQAYQKIAEFAVGHGLSVMPVRGKILEYLKLFKPDIYDMLKRAWSVRITK